jgi:hypothetical protein
MIFDFIKQRAEEGIAQVQNIASKTAVSRAPHPLFSPTTNDCR